MIYLDHAATTPVRPEVLEAMLPFFGNLYGNPSSIHSAGRSVRAALDNARDCVAGALNCEYSEVCFTSGGSEADNLAVIGAMRAMPPRRNRLIISAIEHHAVLHSAKFLEDIGFEVIRLSPDGNGYIHPDALLEAMSDRVGLVSIMHANNELGAIQNVSKFCQIAHTYGALFHTDAVQSFAWLPIDVQGTDCDMLSISAHKLYGPKGVGALYVKTSTKITPIIYGGSQERERRAGTENTAGIVGMGKAVELMLGEQSATGLRIEVLRDRLQSALANRIPNIVFNGLGGPRLSGILNFSVPGIEGSTLLMNLDRAEIAASSGSACSSGSIDPSHVLQAIGLPPDLANGGVRFSLGRGTSEAEVDEVAEIVTGICRN